MATDRAHAFALLVILALPLVRSRKVPSAGLTLGAASFACGSQPYYCTAQTAGPSWCSMSRGREPISATGPIELYVYMISQFIRSWQCDQFAGSWTSFGGLV